MSAVMAATLNILSVYIVVGFIFFADRYAQFISGVNTRHRYYLPQVPMSLKKHLKATCCQLTGRTVYAIRYADETSMAVFVFYWLQTSQYLST